CTRFERSWQAGERPPVEAYLGEVSGSERLVLVRELLLVEVPYRRRAGDLLAAEDYRARFPDLEEAWLAPALAAPAPPPPAPRPPPAAGAAASRPGLRHPPRAGPWRHGGSLPGPGHPPGPVGGPEVPVPRGGPRPAPPGAVPARGPGRRRPEPPGRLHPVWR